jgi:hypothetical protein
LLRKAFYGASPRSQPSGTRHHLAVPAFGSQAKRRITDSRYRKMEENGRKTDYEQWLETQQFKRRFSQRTTNVCEAISSASGRPWAPERSAKRQTGPQ